MPTTLGGSGSPSESEPDHVTRKRRSSNHNLRRLNLCFSSSFTQPHQSSSSSSSSSLPQQQQHHNPPSPTANATSPEPESKPADFATAFASQRFFFSSPGRSNSIVERNNTDTNSSTTAAAANCKKINRPILDGSVAVSTYSPDPYADFRLSMQEMVEARPELLRTEEASSWEALHELLLCYLALNQKSTHKFILRAFSDLLVTLMSFSSSSPPQNSNPSGGGECKKL